MISEVREYRHMLHQLSSTSVRTAHQKFPPYLDGIVSKLLVLLQNGQQMVQEGALTALAFVSDSSQEHFQKYYDIVMPNLKTILVNATDKSNHMHRAKAMEYISLVGMAVGKDKFRGDAKQHGDHNIAGGFLLFLSFLEEKAIACNMLCCCADKLKEGFYHGLIRSDRELLGPNNEYLPKVVQVFAEVLCAGKDLVTEQTASRMITLLRRLQQTLPPAILVSTWSPLQPQQQLALQSMLSSQCCGS